MFIFILFIISVNLTLFVNCINFVCALKFDYSFVSHVNKRLVSTIHEVILFYKT
jgi:hypothetical protein